MPTSKGSAHRQAGGGHAGEVNRRRDAKLAAQLKALGGILGLLQRPATGYLQGRSDVTVPLSGVQVTATAGDLQPIVAPSIDNMIAARVAAKKARNFPEADRIRDELKAAGIILEDGPAGTTWWRA